jgi:tetratricopeptide (TPR) repeat protein
MRKKYVQTIDSLKKIVKLIEKKDEYKEIGISQKKGHNKGQFIKLPLLQVRIKFDANLELAHLYSKLGDHENARKCYVKLEEELKRKRSDLTPNGYSQLESILLLNMGRNELDSQDYNRAIEHFQKILTKGDDVSRDVSSIAHMNLGLALLLSRR